MFKSSAITENMPSLSLVYLKFANFLKDINQRTNLGDIFL